MKQILLFLLAATLFACNSPENKTSEGAKSDNTKVAAVTTADLPCQVKDWATGQHGKS